MKLFRRRPSHPAYCQAGRLSRPCPRRSVFSVSGHRAGDGPVWACNPCTTRLEHAWGQVLVTRP